VDVHVGSRVKLRRTLLGKSQEMLGEAIGITFQQVQKYERGSNRIGCSRLYDLARVLDVPVSYFFDAIPISAQAQSPLNVIKGTVGEETGEIAAASDPMAKRETLDLVRAYYSIPDPQIRRRVYELAKALGGGKDKGG
jgi:transcriptional regulator with XRE-family HTH domain